MVMCYGFTVWIQGQVLKNFLVTAKYQGCAFEIYSHYYIIIFPFPSVKPSTSPSQFARLQAMKDTVQQQQQMALN